MWIGGPKMSDALLIGAPRWSVVAADGATRPLRMLQTQHAWVAEFHAARSAAITAAPRNQSALVH